MSTVSQGRLTRSDELPAATRTRRGVLTGTGASAALALTGTLVGVSVPAAAEHRPDRSEDLFTLGVASGDPLPHAVVIWARLAPSRLEPYGGMKPENATVGWQVSEDEEFGRVVRSGKVAARPEYAHSVHVDMKGLLPWRHYYYRFRAGGQVSRTGQTRTAPRGLQTVDSISLAVAWCQKWDDGLYHAHRDIPLCQPCVRHPDGPD